MESWGETVCGVAVVTVFLLQPDYITISYSAVACDEAVQTLHTPVYRVLSAADQASVCMQAGV